MQHKIRSIQINSLVGRLEAEFLFEPQKDYLRTLTICVTDPVQLDPAAELPPAPGVKVKCGNWMDFAEVAEMVAQSQAAADALFPTNREQWLVQKPSDPVTHPVLLDTLRSAEAE